MLRHVNLLRRHAVPGVRLANAESSRLLDRQSASRVLASFATISGERQSTSHELLSRPILSESLYQQRHFSTGRNLQRAFGFGGDGKSGNGKGDDDDAKRKEDEEEVAGEASKKQDGEQDGATKDGQQRSAEKASDGDKWSGDGIERSGDEGLKIPFPGKPMTALAPFTVPEVFPNVPLLAVDRNPCFPRFVKVLEIADQKLIELIRRKVRLNQPYAGLFLRRDSSNVSEIVRDVAEVYRVGTFVQILEAQDLGDRMKLLVQSHRRVQIVRSIADESERDVAETSGAAGGGRKWRRRRQPVETTEAERTESDQSQQAEQTSGPANASTGADSGKQILMVETENVPTETYKMTEEIRALTGELLKTLRDILALNPLYRESVGQLLQVGERTTNKDSPVFLADLSAALSTAEPQDQQAILEVRTLDSFHFLLILSYLILSALLDFDSNAFSITASRLYHAVCTFV